MIQNYKLTSLGRIVQIDVLRGLAATLVVVAHSSEYFSSRALSLGHSTEFDQLVRSVDFGRIGVVLFFLVSGYVVANTLHNKNQFFRNFVLRRLFRLFPLYWFSMLLAFFFWTNPPPNCLNIMANLTMFPSIWDAHAMLGLYWTLEVELLFYLLALALARMNYLFKPAALICCIFVLLVGFSLIMFKLIPSPSTLEWRSFPYNLSFMLMGVFFYVSKNQEKIGELIPIYWFWLVVLMLLSPAFYSLIRYFSSGDGNNLRLGLAYPIGMILFFAFTNLRVHWISLFARLGIISYSMYLMHLFILVFVAHYIDASMIPLNWQTLPFLVVISMCLTVAFSSLTYKFIERPWIIFSKKFISIENTKNKI